MTFKTYSIGSYLFCIAFIYTLFMPVIGSNAFGFSIINGGTILLGVTAIFLHHRNFSFSYIVAFALIGELIFLFPTLVLSPVIIKRDLFDLIRPMMYFCFFSLGFLSLNKKNLSTAPYTIWRVILVCFIIQAVFAILQKQHAFQAVSSLYTKSHNVSSGRATGTFINPYDLAVMICLPLFYFLAQLFTVRSWKWIIALIITGIFLYSGLASQSKTFFFAVPAGILAWAGAYTLLNRVEKTFSIFLKALVFTLIISLIIIFNWQFFNSKFHYFIHGLQQFLSGQHSTFTPRAEQAHYIFSHMNHFNNAIFGHGVFKANTELPYIENQYMLYLYRYGVIGLVWVVTILIFGLWQAIRLLSYTVSHPHSWLHYFAEACVMFFGMLFVVSMTNPYLDMSRDSQIILMILGFITKFNYLVRFCGNPPIN